MPRGNRPCACHSTGSGMATANGRPRRDAILHRYADAIARRYEPSLADETPA